MRHVQNPAQSGKGLGSRASRRRWAQITAQLTAMFAIINLGAFAQPLSGPAAHWEGGIQMPEKELPLTVDLAKNAKGEWIGSVNFPEGGIVDAPLIQISVEGGAVRFRMGIAHDSFEGKLSDDGNGLLGTATSDEGSAPFHLKRNGEANVTLPPSSTSLSKDFEGTWEGTLDAPGKQLRAILKLTRGSRGAAAGTLISVDEGGQEFPITTLTQQDHHLKFEIRLIRANYTGILDASGAEIAGEYTQGGLTLPLVFKRPAAEVKKP